MIVKFRLYGDQAREIHNHEHVDLKDAEVHKVDYTTKITLSLRIAKGFGAAVEGEFEI
jgi:hypothetical protein